MLICTVSCVADGDVERQRKLKEEKDSAYSLGVADGGGGSSCCRRCCMENGILASNSY